MSKKDKKTEEIKAPKKIEEMNKTGSTLKIEQQQQLVQANSSVLYCIHEACTNDRILSKMQSMMDHGGVNHKLVDTNKLQQFLTEKFSEINVSKIQSTIDREIKIKLEMKQYVKNIKDKLDDYLASEEKNIPSLQSLMQSIKSIQTAKSIQNETVQQIVKFNLESIPKYSMVLVSADNKFSQIQTTIANLIQENPHYKKQVASFSMNKDSWRWGPNMMGTPYKIQSDITSFQTNTFLGYSFILAQPALSIKAIHQIELLFEDNSKEKAMTFYQRERDEGEYLQNCNFAIGLTHLRHRNQRGYDQQDLSLVGHGFYLLRSDGFVCHNSKKEINWTKDGFVPLPNEPIKMIWNPQDHQLLIQQGEQSYAIIVDKISGFDPIHFCVHSKLAKCKIISD